MQISAEFILHSFIHQGGERGEILASAPRGALPTSRIKQSVQEQPRECQGKTAPAGVLQMAWGYGRGGERM